MSASSFIPAQGVCLRALSAALLLALSAGSSSASALGTRANASPSAVTNCDDDGPGSLRATVAAAPSGDTIDLSGLTCGTITLTTGFIAVAQDDLSLIGPGAAALSIDGAYASSVIRHAGAGTLTLSGLTITRGHYESTDTPRGGCLYSASNISLADSTVSDCTALGTGSTITRGGGIYTHGDLLLERSLVTGNASHGTVTGGHGGGVYVRGNFIADASTISNNLAYGVPINGGQGGGAMIDGDTTVTSTTISGNGSYSVGGMWTHGGVVIDSSTISGNSASFAAGMRSTYTTGSPTALLVNSTISGNQAFARVGGINLIIPATIRNTTIAFNDAFNGLGGILMSGPTLDLESTIIADNTGFGVPDDFSGYDSPVITGANNLVITSTDPLPPDTLRDDPLLGTLADNGGPTQTIPLLAGSPAIDTGNDLAGLDTDQRGPGFARVVGLAADIGAFEVQTSDVIFANGFDSAP